MKLVSTLMVIGTLVFASSAFADIPPQPPRSSHACPQEAQACENAGDSFNEPGTCVALNYQTIPPGSGQIAVYPLLRCMTWRSIFELGR